MKYLFKKKEKNLQSFIANNFLISIEVLLLSGEQKKVNCHASQFNYTDGRQNIGLLSHLSPPLLPSYFLSETKNLPRQLYDGFSKIPARDFTIYPGIARKRGPATQKFYNSRAREPPPPKGLSLLLRRAPSSFA